VTLILKPCGRGNWSTLRVEMRGRADLALLNGRAWLELPGLPRRAYWVRSVLA
jgi:hypothetical protein